MHLKKQLIPASAPKDAYSLPCQVLFEAIKPEVNVMHPSASVSEQSHSLGTGIARELALTARVIGAEEAKAIGLVSAVFPDVQALYGEVDSIAATMAAKSPLAITGTKRIMLHCRSVSVRSDGVHC